MSERTERAGAGKGFASSALLVTAVLAIVVGGTILKAPPPTEPVHPIAAPPSPIALGSAIRSDPSPAAPAPAPVEVTTSSSLPPFGPQAANGSLMFPARTA
jgi:hypothetical protein